MRALLLTALISLAATLTRAEVIISEFLADNSNGLRDDFGNREDWIELHNSGTVPADLTGWWISDNASNPTKFQLPELTIPSGQSLIIWASGKNLTDPTKPIHTNFSLSKSGEFLGLFRPHEASGAPVEVHSYSPAFPPQATDVSYGLSFAGSTTTFVAEGTPGRFRILPNNTSGATAYSGTNYASGQIGNNQPGGWNVSPAFDDGAWTLANTGIGYDTGGNLTPWISTNIQSAMRNVNPSLCFRRTFTVADPSALHSLKLMMKYEDGFVAYLNGTEIARANFNGTPTHNSTAISALSGTIAAAWSEFSVPTSLLTEWENLLAIQGLNVTSGSSDFLLLPQLIGTATPVIGGQVYFATPTPAAANSLGSTGTILFDATPTDPNIPRPLGNSASPPQKITIRTIRTQSDITLVRAFHRTQWNAEAALTLRDDGIAPDDIAGDGIFSGNLPTIAPAPGQMLRWRFEARDAAGTITTFPAYADPLDSPRYFGTVAINSTTATSLLPIMEWFVENSPQNGPTTATFRGSCYYLNRFYDNIGHKIRGQSTSAFQKKGYNFDSNDNFRFVWKEGERPVKDLKLITNYGDKTKTRNTLAQEVSAMTGTPHHFAFPVRVHLNAAFHGVMDLVEDGDDRMLDRNGLDGEGAFYKIYDALVSTGGGEKKTRKEENASDLQALITGLNPSSPLATRRLYAYDSVNIPATINYLATRAITSDRDHGHKNYYVYRDTNGTREWQPIIWDVDLSFGHDWNSGPGYFDDTIYHTNTIRHTQTEANRLYRIIAESPEFRQMYLRRLRTLMDDVFQPPGTINGILETRMREIAALVDPDPANPSPWTDGDLDAARWGVWGRGLRPREEVEYVIANHFQQRRTFLYNQNNTTRQRFSLTANTGDPIPDSPQSITPGIITIIAAESSPASGNQAEEFITLHNTANTAVDLSGWTISGGIRHTFAPGTVIPTGNGSAASDFQGHLHLVKNTVAFRARNTGPTAGQRRFIQGNFEGQLSARGEIIELRDPSGLLVHSFTTSSTPTPAQQFLRIAEIQYHPANPSPTELAAIPTLTDNDFEYLELVNTGTTPLVITGASFTEGITFTFPALTLAAGERTILAKNPAAFALRYPDSPPPLGPYSGQLDNSGERLELIDATGEKILDFTYSDDWFPATDGPGRSLTLRDPATPHDAFSDPLSWGISGSPLGSPGSPEPFLAQAYRGWDLLHFSPAELENPAISSPDADPDGDGRSNFEEYALGTHPRLADPSSARFTWHTGNSGTHPAIHFQRPLHAIDLSYELLASDDMETWLPVPNAELHSSPAGLLLETATLSPPSPTPAPQRFLRLRFTYLAP